MIKGSKYVSADINNSFEKVKKDVLQGKTVLFIGLPCVVADLLNYLNDISISNLFTMDLVCLGTPSKLVYYDYLDNVKSKTGKRINSFLLRYKDTKYGGWKNYIERIMFNDGSDIISKDDIV